VSADPKSGQAALRPYGHLRPRRRPVIASGGAAVLTGAAAIWVATELSIESYGWLPWLACALPPAAAGGVCLARRPATSTGPAAVFASCTAAGAYALQIPVGHHGLVLAASLLLLLCAGISVIISATVTAVMITVSGAVSPRRRAVWTGAGLVFAAVLIPSPVYLTGGPIQTIFAGNTGGEDAVAACTLALLAIPLVIAGLAPARMTAVMAAAWLPGAAAQLLGWLVFPFNFLHIDAWYYLSWLVWLAVAVLTLTETRAWRSADHSQPRVEEAH
jgi:hypothetical protein